PLRHRVGGPLGRTRRPPGPAAGGRRGGRGLRLVLGGSFGGVRRGVGGGIRGHPGRPAFAGAAAGRRRCVDGRRRGPIGRVVRAMTTVSVIVPAYNEARALPATLAAVRRLPIDEVIVVDDGSSDGTGPTARRCGAEVVRLPANQGKGAALSAGLSTARGDVLLLLDADLGASACEA